MSIVDDAAPKRRRRVKRDPSGTAPGEPTGSVATAGPLFDASGRSPTGLKSPAATPQPLSRTFLICLSVGTAMAAMGLFENQVARQIGFAGPIIATAFYPLWGRRLGFHKSASLRERFADNCYYLGFIFTQISLVLGFAPVAIIGKQIDAQDVLRFFGVALGASMVGLVARTLLVQTGHSLAENADIIEDEVEKYAKAVAAQSRAVLGEFQGLTGELAATYGKLASELDACVQGVAATLNDFKTSLAAGAASVATSTNGVASAASATAKDMGREQRELALAVTAVATSIEQLRSGMQAKAAEATEAVTRSAEAFARGAEALADVPNLKGSVAALEGTLEEVAGSAERMNEAVTQATADIKQASDDTSASIGEVVEAARRDAFGRAEAFQAELDEAVTAFEQTLKGFKTQLERIGV